jgi:hypothetical protein
MVTRLRLEHNVSSAAVDFSSPLLLANRSGTSAWVLQLPPSADLSRVVSLDEPYLKRRQERMVNTRVYSLVDSELRQP